MGYSGETAALEQGAVWQDRATDNSATQVLTDRRLLEGSGPADLEIVLDEPAPETSEAPRASIAGELAEQSRYLRWVKPVIDRVAGALLILVLSPILLLLIAMTRFTAGSPVIYRQDRVGLNGKVFRIYKLRTMVPDRRTNATEFLGEDRRVQHKTAADPRVTPLGRNLRKWSLDELPQLWNVVRGEMSLVGPRPELVEIVERHYQPWQLERHLVKPGMTGLWQISSRAEGLIYENVHFDLEYIDGLSFATDCKILMKTAQAVLGRATGF